MRIVIGVAAAGLCVVSLTAASHDVLPSPAHTCSSSDSLGSAIQAVIVGLVSETDASSVAERAALQLPQMSGSSVTLVTQTQTCNKAADALDLVQNNSVANRAMYVYKLGNTRFAVYEPAASITGLVPLYIFTNKWAFLSIGRF